MARPLQVALPLGVAPSGPRWQIQNPPGLHVLSALSDRPAAAAALSRPASLNDVLATAARFIKAEDQASGRDGRFINQKRTNGQIPGFGARIVIFFNLPYKEFINGRATHEFWVSSKNEVAVLSRQQQPNDYFNRSELSFPRQKSNLCWPFYQGRPASMAVLSAMAALSRARAKPVAPMAVLSTRSGQIARSLDLRCGWPISYCPAQAVYQRPS